jgi:transposase
MVDKSHFMRAEDPLQVKYEMLRAHYVDGVPVAAAARTFGLSRQSFYQAAEAFSRAGFAGLAAKKRGPKGAHKLTTEVSDFLVRQGSSGGRVSCVALARQVREELGVSLHPHTIQRTLKQLRG